MKIVIIDYGAGNIQSIMFAIKRLGFEAVLSHDAEEIRNADKVIFPGVGEASSAMEKLRATGLDKVIPTLKQPVLGICLGMQLMCHSSEEGKTEGLGIFDLDVVEKLYSGYGEMSDEIMCNETQSLGFKCDGPSRTELFDSGYSVVLQKYPKLDAILYAEEIALQEKGSLIDARGEGGGFFYFVLSCTILGFLACFFRMHVVNRRRKTVARRASKYTAYVASEQDDLSQLHQTLREQFAAANEGVSVDIKVESEKLKSRVIEQMNERRQQRGSAANPFISSSSLELEDGDQHLEQRSGDDTSNNDVNTIRF